MVMGESVQDIVRETTADISTNHKMPTPIVTKKIIFEKLDPVDKEEFNNWLLNKVSRQSTMISRTHGEKIIQYLRHLREKGKDSQEIKANFSANFRFQVKKRKFQLIRVGGLGDILCMPMQDKMKITTHAMLGQHRQVIFKEDMFDVIDSAHRQGEKHRGYKGTFKKISATYCNIPREVVHKYVSMCVFCQKMHACYIPAKCSTSKPRKKIPPPVKKKEVEMAFLTRGQIDIMDMTNVPDVEGNFSYIGHFLDHHSKYNVLFPLKKDDAFYVAKKLCRYVFSHFGLPRILHSNMGRKYVDEIIRWILQLWSADTHILNGNPNVKRINSLILQRQKTIVVLIETIRLRQSDSSCNWSAWLPGIQYSLNTNQFDPATPPAYDTVFNRRPAVYTYQSSPGEIPREEDYHIISSQLTEPEPPSQPPTQPPTQGVVTTPSIGGEMNNQPTSILISNLGSHNVGNASSELTDHTEMKENNENIARTDILNCSQFSPVSLTLGEQMYTITRSALRLNSSTVESPYVSAGAENSNSVATLANEDNYSEERAKAASGMLYYTDPVEQFTSSLDIGAVENEHHEHFAAHNGDQEQFNQHKDQEQFVELNGEQEQHVNHNGNLVGFVNHTGDHCQLISENGNDDQDMIQSQHHEDTTNTLQIGNVIIHHPRSFQLTMGDSSDESNQTPDDDNVMTSLHLDSNVEEHLTSHTKLTSCNNPSSMDLSNVSDDSRTNYITHATLHSNTLDVTAGSLCTTMVDGVTVHLISRCQGQEMNNMEMEEVDVTGTALGLSSCDGSASNIQMTDSLATGNVQLNGIPMQQVKVEVGVMNDPLKDVVIKSENVNIENSFVEDSENTDFENDESDERGYEEYDKRL